MNMTAKAMNLTQKLEEAELKLKISLLNHIYKKISEVERATKCVCALQFAVHPEGLAMILRCYQASLDKEHSFTDVIISSEIINGGVEAEIKRIDILFDTIHKALRSVQVIKEGAGGLLH